MSTHVFPSSFRRKPGWHLHCEEAKHGAGKATAHAAYSTHLLLENSDQNFMVFTYLEAYFKIFTELGAATQFAVQALVNKAVQLVGAVATVVLVVTEQRLIDTVSIIAGVCGVIAFLLCSMKERNEMRNK